MFEGQLNPIRVGGVPSDPGFIRSDAISIVKDTVVIAIPTGIGRIRLDRSWSSYIVIGIAACEDMIRSPIATWWNLPNDEPVATSIEILVHFDTIPRFRI
jgi:hypothetical protein